MDKYIINLQDKNDDLFGLADKNVAQITVLNSGTATRKHRILFALSKEALIGLGTELIRLSDNFKEGYHTHLDPSEKNSMVQNMGIFLTAQSCELIISCCEFGTIEENV